ncbi:MAG: hypothetical protein MPJ24_10650, partial [Pirellulaceae bacterium]|nr:hypothetical protein [Pirellulaceae bacterium]
TLSTEKFGDITVTLLSTADNRLRSFYAEIDGYHFVTNSRYLVRRFLEAAKGEDNLATSKEFQYARSVQPEEASTLFVYLSESFFHNLLTPHYQIELRRRLGANAKTQLTHLEKLLTENRSSLGQFLDVRDRSKELLHPIDQSGPIVSTDAIYDSLRGRRGYFTPIPDLEVTKVSTEELEEYVTFVQKVQGEWPTLAPIMLTVNRRSIGATETPLEEIYFNAWMLPFNREKYGDYAAMLGRPTTRIVAPRSGDVVSFQAVLAEGVLAPGRQNYHYFVGMTDQSPIGNLQNKSLISTYRLLRDSPVYLGAWPKPGLLDHLPLGIGNNIDYEGFSRYPLGLWRTEVGPFSLVSFDRELLKIVRPQLAITEAPTEAQARLEIKDLSATETGFAWLDSLNYTRAVETTRGNEALLNSLANQLQLDAKEAKSAIETLLDTNLICPLGGEYRLNNPDSAYPFWTSSHSQKAKVVASPASLWFRGLRAELIHENDRLNIQATLLMQPK